jgi:hypothetical protein
MLSTICLIRWRKTLPIASQCPLCLLAEHYGLPAGIQGSGGTLAGWDIYGNATRAEVAQVLWNLLCAGRV